MFDDFSTVELPILPDDTVQLLQKTRLRGRPMDIAIDDSGIVSERPPRKRTESELAERASGDGFGKLVPRASRTPQHEDAPRSPFAKKAYDKPPFEKKPYEKKTFEKKPFEKKPFEKKPFEKKPFEKQPFAKKVFDGKSTKKPRP